MTTRVEFFTQATVALTVLSMDPENERNSTVITVRQKT